MRQIGNESEFKNGALHNNHHESHASHGDDHYFG